MSDAFFEKLFGDSQPGNFGTGWISGTASVFFGLLGFGGALCLHFPGLLSLPDARAVYPMTIIRALIQGAIVLAIVLGAISGLLRERKVLAVTGASLGLLAAIIGGGSTPLPDEVPSKFGLGLDWFLLDLFVMTVVFVPVERFWDRAGKSWLLLPAARPVTRTASPSSCRSGRRNGSRDSSKSAGLRARSLGGAHGV